MNTISKQFFIHCFLVLIMLCASYQEANAQKEQENKNKGNKLSPDELANYRRQVESLVSFLAFTLNTLGSKETSPQDKEVIIQDSYAKFFRDDKVQIEDDLDFSRSTPVNKGVQAYLKDIDFFFKDVSFEFDVSEINHYVTDNKVFFKVTLNRLIQGVSSITKDSIRHTQTRYIELNLDPVAQDLRIVSIYTTKLNRDEELKNWWQKLTPEWKSVFSGFVNVQDSITVRQLNVLADLESIDISENTNLQDLRPLTQLSELKSIRANGTSFSDLTPLRNLNKLEVLQIGITNVKDLSPLRYMNNLKELYINDTDINDLSPIEGARSLERLYAYSTKISSLAPLQNMRNLQDLRLSATAISDLTPLTTLTELRLLELATTRISSIAPLANLQKIERLDISNTAISDLSPLSKIKSLRILFANGSKIKSLTPLVGLSNLEKVYCDNSPITRDNVRDFNSKQAQTLIVFASQSLQNWWKELPAEWKTVFTAQAKVSSAPTVEELAQISGLTTINIEGNAAINTLEPLRELLELRSLNANKTSVSNIEPLQDLIALRDIKLNRTQVLDLRPLSALTDLEALHIENTRVSDLSPLKTLKNLKLLYCDSNPMPENQVLELLTENPNMLIIYRTAALNDWWRNLEQEWKTVFEKYVQFNGTPTKEQLHTITSLETINVNDNKSIRNLQPLAVFIRLKELRLAGTSVTDVSPLRPLRSLKILQLGNTPITNLDPLNTLGNLEVLDIENTPMDNLSIVSALISLKTLRCSGTQIKNLACIEKVKTLEVLECNNTRVRSIKQLMNMPSLRVLRCYNTRISQRNIDKFKEANPQCEVVFY
ncbi:MAG: hypothetical protein JJT94_09005 [Bernardetiaceae bacterium]|nr:hypothetical protein [Bernardetiaceae bacterium]